jgi:glycosyltransferase involved in cell wall biosynthesis
LKCDDLEFHDRVLAYQYGAYSAFQSAQHLTQDAQAQKAELLSVALDFAIEGIKLDPSRAEFHCTAGDVFIYQGLIHKALGFYGAAQKCINPKEFGGVYEGAVYSFIDCYGLVPTLQLAKCFYQMGRLDDARKEALVCVEKYNSAEAKELVAEIDRIQALTNLDNNQEQTEDIVISCPPQCAYPFDEAIYKEKGLGGSETALIQMAKYLAEFTKRPVKVFNMREETTHFESGVTYIPSQNIGQYMSKFLPRVHIAWRHNIKLTRAKTYLWAHDLVTGGIESTNNFDKMICLSDFHKSYAQAKQGVKADKIWVSRNGITPEKFNFERKPKNPNKFVFMSSPDRGLDRAMEIMDLMIKDKPELELHVYYGIENLYKYGMGALADKLKQMFAERPWVKYHGFTEQEKMYHEVSDAVIWLHPCNFIETFCITALEMLALKVFPVTRRLGALRNTLKNAEENGQAIMLEHNGETLEQKMEYIAAIEDVLKNKRWEGVSLNLSDHDWKEVAKEWVKEMEL